MTSARTAAGTAYDLAGPSAAPLVTLVHGLGLNRHTWDALLPDLAARYRVLNYDLFGHGESAPPPAPPTLTLFSQQLRELLDRVGVERCAVVGFSLGGMINRRFALDHAARVAALVILNSPHERDPEAQRLVEERVEQTAAGGPAATLQSTLERWFTPAFLAGRPPVVERVREWVLCNDPDTYTQCRRVLARGVTELVRPQPPIVAPTLVMTCEHDSGSTPAMTQAIVAEIPGARAVVLPGLQHMEAPERFAPPLLGFLHEALAAGSERKAGGKHA